MQINADKVNELESLNLAGGIDKFRSCLGRILLPHDRRQRPNARFIRKANQYRFVAS